MKRFTTTLAALALAAGGYMAGIATAGEAAPAVHATACTKGDPAWTVRTLESAVAEATPICLSKTMFRSYMGGPRYITTFSAVPLKERQKYHLLGPCSELWMSPAKRTHDGSWFSFCQNGQRSPVHPWSNG